LAPEMRKKIGSTGCQRSQTQSNGSVVSSLVERDARTLEICL
jgi:hypothetical protein